MIHFLLVTLSTLNANTKEKHGTENKNSKL